MKYTQYFGFLMIILLSFQGCGTQDKITLSNYYSHLKKHQPKSILILPPVNHTTATNASSFYLSTLNEVLSDKGYYTFPSGLVNSFFKSENLFEPEMIRSIKLEKLDEVFNADAILYIDIFEWDTKYKVFTSEVITSVRMTLIDVKSKKEIWYTNAYGITRTGAVSGGIIELIASAIDSAINSGTDYTELAFNANAASSYNLLAGKYSPNFGEDLNKNMYFAEEQRTPEKFISLMDIKDGQVRITKSIPVVDPKKGELVVFSAKYNWKYNGLVFNNPSYFSYDDFDNFYYTFRVGDKKQVRHRFFNYENDKPFVIADNKKVFLTVDDSNKLIYYKEKGIVDTFLKFDIERIVK